jgi:hypothetical protein
MWKTLLFYTIGTGTQIRYLTFRIPTISNSEGFRTSLFTLGRALLQNAVVRLGIEELRSWYEVEKKRSDFVKI